MKQAKLRAVAAFLAGGLAAATVVSAIALQGAGDAADEGSSAAVTTTIDDQPIRYAGGYGLYPNVR